jgi:hypothetical protein
MLIEVLSDAEAIAKKLAGVIVQEARAGPSTVRKR